MQSTCIERRPVCVQRAGTDVTAKLLEEQPCTYVLVLGTGEEITSTLKRFASEQNLAGAVSKPLERFPMPKSAGSTGKTKKYETAAEIHEQVEVLSLIGDIALHEGKPQVHAHMVIGKKDGMAHGGHLLEARVRPTLEVILTESPKPLHKKYDPESGLALIRP
jgi:predicted DNA-binding protein with PD1-like motif